MKNLYTAKFAKKLDFASQLKTKKEKENLIADIINKIYSDGFEDGYNEKENENIQMLERENKNLAKALKKLKYTPKQISDIANGAI